jgi:hypothetical protein
MQMIRRHERTRGWNWFRRRSQGLVVCAAALLLAGLAVGSVVGGNFGDGTNAAFTCPNGSGPISSGPNGSGPISSGPISSAPISSAPPSNPITSGSGCPIFSSPSSKPVTTTQTQTQTQAQTQTQTQTQAQGPPPPPEDVFAGIIKSQFGTLTPNGSGLITIPGTLFTCPSGDVRCIIRASGSALFPNFKATVQAAKKKKPKRLALGTTQTTVIGGAQGSAKLKLGKKVLKALKKSKKVKATFAISVHNAAGATIGTRTVTATIKAPRKGKH